MELYNVPDLVSNKCELIFIVESPHINELVHRHPLSSESGDNMMKLFISENLKTGGNDLPFGCWLKRCIDYKCFEQLGIINASTYPMQNKVYSCSDKEKYLYLEKIRNIIDPIGTKIKQKEFCDLFSCNKEIFTNARDLRKSLRNVINGSKGIISSNVITSLNSYANKLKCIVKDVGLEKYLDKLSEDFNHRTLKHILKTTKPSFVICGYISLAIFLVSEVYKNYTHNELYFIYHPSKVTERGKLATSEAIQKIKIKLKAVFDTEYSSVVK